MIQDWRPNDGGGQRPPEDEEQKGFSTPSISLPKGGGAIRGLGEKFAANPVTGTGSMTLPITTSPGRSGFGPQLNLAYDSGSGNGPFGFGWSLSIPAITRKTDKGLPQYRDAEESDVYLLSGAEDLVPVLQPDGSRFEDTTTRPGYTIHRYRPRIEGLFAGIERWTSLATGEVHWRSITRENITTLYGSTENSRIADPGDPRKVYSWLICESYDDKGNATMYGYKGENSQGVDTSQVHERNRSDLTRSPNRYLKSIRYGNRTPYYPRLDQEAHDTPLPSEWLFEVVFDYGEHSPEAPAPGDTGEWSRRIDPFSTYRAGFEIRTYRLCQRVLMFHHFPGEPGVGENCLVRSTDFTYSYENAPDDPRNPIFSFLLSVSHSGYKRFEDGSYLKKSLPPLEFEYSQPIIQEDVRDVDPASLQNLPVGLDNGRFQWVDLDGEGLSGILTEQAGSWFYKRNQGPINVQSENGEETAVPHFGPLEQVTSKPSPAAITGGRQQLLDLEGDGQLDLVNLAGPVPGFFERTPDEGWEPFAPFTSLPYLDWENPDVKLVDLTGDGHADILISEDDAWLWHLSLGEAGFGPSERVFKVLDEEQGPRLIFADGMESIQIADLSGDGLGDIVRIRSGEVCYWPNLGYGRFGAKVTMDSPPRFDATDLFDPRRTRMSDVDGSGVTDIIYLGSEGVRVYFNQSGNSWSEARALAAFPAVDDLSAVQAVDLLGSGTACLVWSSSLPGDSRRPMRYIDLMGAEAQGKPHLLIKSANNLGAETHVHYAPSTKFYLADRLAGKPWITRLPFPVHVVERVETYDRISGNRFVTRFTYHHGYFDGVEREFRGFGMVEQFDTETMAALSADGLLPPATNEDEASHVPPVYTKTWFHTGAYLDREHISNYFAGALDGKASGERVRSEYYREPGLDNEQARALLLEDTVLPAGLTIDEEREACRSLKGAMLRQEMYALDGTEKHPHPYSVTEQNFTIRRLQPRAENRHGVFLTHSRETVRYHYERVPADPRVAHTLTLEVDDFGNVLKSASIGYGRRQPDLSLTPEDQQKQAQVLVMLTENSFTNAIELGDDYRAPLPAESFSYELTGLALSDGQNRFSLEALQEAAFAAAPLAYEETLTEGVLQKRLIEHARTLYRPDDLGASRGDPLALLPLGQVEALALPGESHKLAFTPGLVDQVYGGKITDAMLSDEGGYIKSQGEDGWWIPSGRVFFSPITHDGPAEELAYAREHFFVPRRFRDPFHRSEFETEAFIDYDKYDLLPRQTRDTFENTISALNDYRVQQPFLMTDPNGNRTELIFDVLGLVTGTAVMGKANENLGDSLNSFEADLSEAIILDHLTDPLADPHSILGQATTRLAYDLFAYYRTRDQIQPAPPAVYMLARETHAADLNDGEQTRIQHSFSYSDGFGREIQKKLQAEPGPAPQRDAEGRIILGVDGQPQMTEDEVSPRWVGSGWTVFNNKGKPVRQYEPFFTDTHRFEFDVRIGVSPILFYDPLQRAAGTLNPNHTWQKVVFDPWRQETWDLNDTVLIADPQADPELGDFFRRLPETDYLPTWHAARIGGAIGPQEQAAAEKTAAHAGTPAVAYLDSLARTFLTIAHNRIPSEESPAVDEFYRTTVNYDIEGNQREVIDAKNRVIVRYDYNIPGNVIHSMSMDASERWMLNEVTGEFIYGWDSRDHRLRTTYDALRRPVEVFLIEGDGLELMVGRTVYGDTQQDAETNNLRGKVYRTFDGAGVATNEIYDFKGNLLRSSRQLAAGYKGTVDWSDEAELETEVFTASRTFDALNRAVSLTSPDNSVIRPSYNDANLLERIDGNLRGAGMTTTFVQDIDYDSKGQRTRIDYGNAVHTTYEYDLLTFRLARLQTVHGIERLQDLSYTYDPAGNITHIQDDAQQKIIFNNSAVEPHADYTYDAIYQLVQARAREHIGQTALDFNPPDGSYRDYPFLGQRVNPNDPRAVRSYTEIYQYDEVGNILQMIHQAANGSWTRTYAYNEPSLIEGPDKVNNRLSSTTVGNATERYVYDAHGSMTTMSHLPLIQWNYLDQLQAAARQVVNDGSPETTYSVYDAAGQRVRKVTERQVAVGETPSRMKERIYLGGLEIYREYSADGSAVTLERETLHVMDEEQRVAMVETRTLGDDGSAAQLTRYQFSNHLGSASLEMDDMGRMISYEEYFPFGCTSYQAVDANIRAAAKRYRFTGMERDEETGLNYHGARYYACWLGRWSAADPAGIIDGTNLYAYCRNSPTVLTDPGGYSSGPEEIARVLDRSETEMGPLASPYSDADLLNMNATSTPSELQATLSPSDLKRLHRLTGPQASAMDPIDLEVFQWLRLNPVPESDLLGGDTMEWKQRWENFQQDLIKRETLSDEEQVDIVSNAASVFASFLSGLTSEAEAAPVRVADLPTVDLLMREAGRQPTASGQALQEATLRALTEIALDPQTAVARLSPGEIRQIALKGFWMARIQFGNATERLAVAIIAQDPQLSGQLTHHPGSRERDFTGTRTVQVGPRSAQIEGLDITTVRASARHFTRIEVDTIAAYTVSNRLIQVFQAEALRQNSMYQSIRLPAAINLTIQQYQQNQARQTRTRR